MPSKLTRAEFIALLEEYYFNFMLGPEKAERFKATGMSVIGGTSAVYNDVPSMMDKVIVHNALYGTAFLRMPEIKQAARVLYETGIFDFA